jgi:S-adenosylmethionine:tRNA ribosyltransferase-isomerase
VAEELQISDFDYDLPPDLIAQAPCEPRDQARLLVVERTTGRLHHRRVADLPELLRPQDLLVVNNTRVIPARLYGHRAKTGGKWEGLFLRQRENGLWEMLSQSKGKLLEGEELIITASPLRLTLRARTAEGHFLMEPSEPGPPEMLLDRYGHIPLPPYIRGGQDAPSDKETYQTVFAQRAGAVAAPTAGLHFTPELLAQLARKGIPKAEMTLHVGIGTFQPIKVESLAEHRMHAEWCEVPAATVAAIEQCRREQGRVVAVGTTTVRTLESVTATGPLRPWAGFTDLFITPPYRFRVVDVLLTNFHLPRSTLLVLVSAFAGRELIQRAYAEAVREKYRFYSYGDAMLLV